MDSDSFYPAFVTAAKVLGLGEVLVRKIKTTGLQLYEKTGFETINAITWFNEAKGRVGVKISGIYSEAEEGRAIDNLYVQVGDEVVGAWATILHLKGSLTEPAGELGNGIFFSVANRITKFAETKTLFNSVGQSDFVQYWKQTNLPEQIRIRWGQSTVTFEGSQFSVVRVAAHGFNKGGVVVFCTPVLAVFIPVVTAMEANNFAVQGYSPGGASTGTYGFYWVAIG